MTIKIICNIHACYQHKVANTTYKKIYLKIQKFLADSRINLLMDRISETQA